MQFTLRQDPGLTWSAGLAVLVPLFLPGGADVDSLVRAQIGIVAFQSAYIAEVIRGGLQAIPRGQYEAAQALGLGYWRMMIKIILPQALKIVIPNIKKLFKDNSKYIIM